MTDAPKLWLDMTDAEKAEILLADHRGEELQAWLHDDRWEEKRNCFPYRDTRAYRVKPKAQKVETFVSKVQLWNDSGIIRIHCGHDDEQGKLANITHTYTITDGRVTACDTIIHD